MKAYRKTLFLAAVLLCLCLISSALAKTVSSAVGGFSLTLPEGFEEQSVSGSGDPDLCLHWKKGHFSVQAYASYLGEVAGSDLFQVLTGSETDSGMVTYGGMSMLYASGADSTGAYMMYSWMDRGNNVTLYFYFPEGDKDAASTVESIMRSITFDAGH